MGIDPLKAADLTDIRTILGEMRPLMLAWYNEQKAWFLHHQNWFGHLHDLITIQTDVNRNGNQVLRDIFYQMGGAYASGGIVYEDSVVRVAEGGNPEAIIPLQSGAVPVQLTGLPAVGGSGGDSPATVAELRALRAEVKAMRSSMEKLENLPAVNSAGFRSVEKSVNRHREVAEDALSEQRAEPAL